MAEEQTESRTDEERFTKDRAGADAGGRAHTTPEEGHPAGDEARSARDVGGPRAEEDAPDATGEPGAHGDRPTPGMEPHE